MASSRGGVPGMPTQRRARDARGPGTSRAAPACRGAAASRTARPASASSATTPPYITTHAVADLGHHAQVVGDDDHRHPEVAREPGQQLQDLGLDHHVERGGRLVGDDHVGVAGQRQRDHRALAHAARVGVRVLARRAGARCPPARAARLRRARRAVRATGARGRGSPRAPGPRPAHRVERVHRALEDERQARPAHGSQLATRRAPTGPRRRTAPAPPTTTCRRAAAAAAGQARSSSCRSPTPPPGRASRRAAGRS